MKITIINKQNEKSSYRISLKTILFERKLIKKL
ncbi:hypothetical protein [Staphylococcus phage vB_StaM_PB50]|nr:hypothetical protein [Staphylococcus phage vB_StaM_PB50]